MKFCPPTLSFPTVLPIAASILSFPRNAILEQRAQNSQCSVFLKKNYIMDENDSLAEYIKIPLGHNRTNGAVYPKINFKLRSALHFSYSIVIRRFYSRANTAQS